MIISWASSLETGFSSIDDGRKRIIEMINLFADEHVVMHARSISPAFLDGIRKLFSAYFESEEDAMFRIEYPDSDKHMLAHSVLLTSLDMAILNCKETGSPHLIADFVTDHIVAHLNNDETSFALYVQKKRHDRAARSQKSQNAPKGGSAGGAQYGKPLVRR